jgi:glycoprotease/Kae1 family metallohydrolase
MYCLAFESTAHTFGVAIIDAAQSQPAVLANVRKAYTTVSGGMVPSKVSDHHVAVAQTALSEALSLADCTQNDIALVAFSQGPGIGSCLRVGATLARSIALRHNIPLIGVNHCVAHLEIGRVLSGFSDPVLLYASGANTQIIAYEEGVYRVFGETLDMGVGNFLDHVGRILGLGFPAGPAIEQLAKSGEYYALPYTVKGMDVQFGGLVTRLKADAAEKPHANICRSVQETAFAMLTEIAERALSHTGKTELVLGGGVACNARLQYMVSAMCAERDARMFAPQREYLVDNAAMIGVAAVLMWRSGYQTAIEASGILPHQRTDAVQVTWR